MKLNLIFYYLKIKLSDFMNQKSKLNVLYNNDFHSNEFKAGIDCLKTARAIDKLKMNQYKAVERWYEEAAHHFENANHIQLAIQMYSFSGNKKEIERLKIQQFEELKKFHRK